MLVTVPTSANGARVPHSEIYRQREREIEHQGKEEPEFN